jgi:hypothetical protein
MKKKKKKISIQSLVLYSPRLLHNSKTTIIVIASSTTTPWPATTTPNSASSPPYYTIVPLHMELYRRYREIKGCGWIWTMALIVACVTISILPENEYKLFQLWAGVATGILVTSIFAPTYGFGLVEINLERVQRTGVLLARRLAF